MNSRRPAVAGTFYPGVEAELRREIEACLGAKRPRRPVLGAIVPHAGYVYSGAVAGAVYSRIEIPERVVILCPNHTGLGVPAAVDPHPSWTTPLGEVPVDEKFRSRILELAPHLELDSRAHDREHSLEVQLPFLQFLRPGVAIVPICIGSPDVELCREIGEACAMLLSDSAPPLLLASSDMNHYESRNVGDPKNRKALDRIEALDARGLFATVLSEDISMCGFLPATALLFAAAAGGARNVEIAALSDSGDVTGDLSSVVGYAGVIIE